MHADSSTFDPAESLALDASLAQAEHVEAPDPGPARLDAQRSRRRSPEDTATRRRLALAMATAAEGVQRIAKDALALGDSDRSRYWPRYLDAIASDLLRASLDVR